MAPEPLASQAGQRQRHAQFGPCFKHHRCPYASILLKIGGKIARRHRRLEGDHSRPAAELLRISIINSGSTPARVASTSPSLNACNRLERIKFCVSLACSPGLYHHSNRPVSQRSSRFQFFIDRRVAADHNCERTALGRVWSRHRRIQEVGALLGQSRGGPAGVGRRHGGAIGDDRAARTPSRMPSGPA